MSSRATAETTQRELSYRKRLIEIANLINSAPGIAEILVDLKDRILDLVEAERVTIFALDTKNQELYSLFKAGNEVKEIRVPKTFGSIAGFTALSRRTANVKNAYDTAELTRLHPNLRFDSRWDKASGFKTQEVLATPILFEKYLLGVLQLINKRGGGDLQRARRGGGRGALQDPRHRVLQPAPRRPQQQALQVRPAGGQGPALREGRRERRRHRARQPGGRHPILLEDYKISKEELLGALAPLLQLRRPGPGRTRHARGPQGAAGARSS